MAVLIKMLGAVLSVLVMNIAAGSDRGCGDGGERSGGMHNHR